MANLRKEAIYHLATYKVGSGFTLIAKKRSNKTCRIFLMRTG